MRKQSGRNEYLETQFSISHKGLQKISKEMERDGLAGMSLSGSEARILQFLISNLQVKSIVEIGSLYGHSALAMALALPESGRIDCLEKEESRCEKVRSHLKDHVACRFAVHSGSALESLKKLEPEGPFDLVFIDANKSGYLEYLDWAEANTKQGSLIVGDNTFLFGALWGESSNKKVSSKQVGVMKEFNRRLSDTSKYDSMLIPTPEGMTVARRKF